MRLRKAFELAVIAVLILVSTAALAIYVSFAFPDLNNSFIEKRVTVLQWRKDGTASSTTAVEIYSTELPESMTAANTSSGNAAGETPSPRKRGERRQRRQVTTTETVLALRDLIWFIVSVFLILMTVWSYIMVASTDPGAVPRAFHLDEEGSAALALYVGNMDVCRICKVYKPPRAHHCSRCNRCVLKYDHHCPWITQCVGFMNYKLFLVFIFYSWLLSLLVTVSLSHAVYLYLLRAVSEVSTEGSTLNEWSNQTADLVRKTPPLPIGSASASTSSVTWPVVLTWMYAFSLQWLLSYLVFKHRRLSRHNATTLDEVIRGDCTENENEYDLGEEENLAMVYGDGFPLGEQPSTRARILRTLCRWLPIRPYKDASSATPCRPPIEDDGIDGEEGAGATEMSRLAMSPGAQKAYGTLVKNRNMLRGALSPNHVHHNSDSAPSHHQGDERHKHHHRSNPNEPQHHHHHHHHGREDPHSPTQDRLAALIHVGTSFRKNSVV